MTQLSKLIEGKKEILEKVTINNALPPFLVFLFFTSVHRHLRPGFPTCQSFSV